MIINEFEEKKRQFLNYIETEKNLALNTCRAYKIDLEQFSQFWNTAQERRQRDLTFQEAVVAYNVSISSKKIDKRSVARKLSALSSLVKFLKKNGIEFDVKFERPSIEKKALHFLKDEDITFLVEQLPTEKLLTHRPARDRAILELLYSTGIRCSEVVEIKIQDIDWNARTILIQSKRKKSRVVEFGIRASFQLREYIKNERIKDQDGIDEGYLFLNNRCQKLTTRSIQRICEMFEKFLEQGKMITPHILRHSFAINMLSQGMDIKRVEELLGLKTLAITKQYDLKPQETI
ncbi:tyrosine-type recombinase/integrase [Candidatus Dependentiae bacterium]|nr:tyrosine-type recombinase/integrase [Candidatus Dependentiae bacterium]